ncbi:MAG: CPBP family intramembrane metalloprotease [Gemmatimonadaceae bacterium]|nr:CPBP family intramembrane metalloprotease [Gemmatimonadaceae bacterium]
MAVVSASERIDEAIRIAGRLAALIGLAGTVFIFIGIALKPVLPGGLPRGLPGQLLFQLIITFALAVAHLAAGILFDRGDWRITGVASEGWRPLGLLVGAGTGLAAVAVPAGLLLGTGLAALDPTGGARGVAAADLALALLALTAAEELAVRGYLVGLLEARWGDAAALVASALGSIVVLLMRDGVVTPASIVAVGALGACLGALRVVTGGIAAGFVAHYVIEVTQAFAFDVAPLATGPGFPLDPRWHGVGPAWLSGGSAGSGAGLVAAATLGAVTFLLFRARRRLGPGAAHA